MNFTPVQLRKIKSQINQTKATISKNISKLINAETRQ